MFYILCTTINKLLQCINWCMQTPPDTCFGMIFLLYFLCWSKRNGKNKTQIDNDDMLKIRFAYLQLQIHHKLLLSRKWCDQVVWHRYTECVDGKHSTNQHLYLSRISNVSFLIYSRFMHIIVEKFASSFLWSARNKCTIHIKPTICLCFITPTATVFWVVCGGCLISNFFFIWKTKENTANLFNDRLEWLSICCGCCCCCRSTFCYICWKKMFI